MNMLLLAYSPNTEERRSINEGSLSAAAYYEDEFELVSRIFGEQREYRKAMRCNKKAEICCLSVGSSRDLQLCIESRASFSEAMILLVADANLSPVAYMKPEITAASLLLKPISVDDAARAFGELLRVIAGRLHTDETMGKLYVIEQRGAKLRVRYSDIEYFEARDKKVYLCTKQKQHGIYTTLDTLENTLPHGFMRCHKSFIVNTTLIESMSLSENLIYLSGGVVPVSRSYKAKIAEVIHGHH